MTSRSGKSRTWRTIRSGRKGDMKRTNVTNIPDSLCRLVDSFEGKHKEPGNISCTQLIDSPLVRILKKKYYDTDELTIDYQRDLCKIAGSIVHYIIENVEQTSLKVP